MVLALPYRLGSDSGSLYGTTSEPWFPDDAGLWDTSDAVCRSWDSSAVRKDGMGKSLLAERSASRCHIRCPSMDTRSAMSGGAEGIGCQGARTPDARPAYATIYITLTIVLR